MKLIVGLGNKGEEHELNRHNTGFIILDYILGKNIDWKKSSGTEALFYRDSISGKSIEYLKPLTFMNNSGVAVAYTKEKHKIPPKDIVVIYDDIDLPIGTMKLSFDRGSGGHNGLESVIKKLKSREFLRVRVGISPVTPGGKIRKPKGENAVYKFLLGDFKKSELDVLKKLSKKINESIEVALIEGKEKAMSLFNK